MMVRPALFGYNEETAINNAFQKQDGSMGSEEVHQQALAEFDAFVSRLRSVGVEVIVVEDKPQPITYDAVFPNNWITFHADGRLATYPMNAPMRRLERREDVVRELKQRFGFSEHLHFEKHEEEGKFLEGTGSLILDRPNRLAYACLSPRTDEGLLDEFCEKMGYEKVAFTAVDGKGQQIYHTNVMMALGENLVIVCLDTVKDEKERQLLLEKFRETDKEVIEISLDQMMSFAGNMLQVASRDGQSYLVMSEQAYRSLTEEQVKQIEKYTKILHSPLYTIEKYGGGSARCMMAEIFAPGE